MAERLKHKIVEQEKMVDVVCGPDAYRDLPRMLAQTQPGQAAGRLISYSYYLLNTLYIHFRIDLPYWAG